MNAARINNISLLLNKVQWNIYAIVQKPFVESRIQVGGSNTKKTDFLPYASHRSRGTDLKASDLLHCSLEGNPNRCCRHVHT